MQSLAWVNNEWKVERYEPKQKVEAEPNNVYVSVTDKVLKLLVKICDDFILEGLYDLI